MFERVLFAHAGAVRVHPNNPKDSQVDTATTYLSWWSAAGECVFYSAQQRTHERTALHNHQRLRRSKTATCLSCQTTAHCLGLAIFGVGNRKKRLRECCCCCDCDCRDGKEFGRSELARNEGRQADWCCL